jgi:hypothetical protein
MEKPQNHCWAYLKLVLNHLEFQKTLTMNKLQISLQIQWYIICIIPMNGMKTVTKIFSKNTNRRENLIITFWNDLKIYIILENFQNIKVSKFDKIYNDILFA